MEAVISLEGEHIRKIVIKKCGTVHISHLEERAEKIATTRDWYSFEWKLCCTRPKNLGAGFNTDWIVYFVNKNILINRIKKKEKKKFTDWFNVLKIK